MSAVLVALVGDERLAFVAGIFLALLHQCQQVSEAQSAPDVVRRQSEQFAEALIVKHQNAVGAERGESDPKS